MCRSIIRGDYAREAGMPFGTPGFFGLGLMKAAHFRRSKPKFTKRSSISKRSWIVQILMLCLLPLTIVAVSAQSPAQALSTGQGDGLAVYGVVGNTTPQWRTYTNATNSFSAASGTVAGNTGSSVVMRTSPTKQEAIAGYVSSTGILTMMCFDGTSWSNEWNVSVGGTATTRRFDISYETNSGNVMVLYSTDTASTNELAYRTKPGSAGCGSSNWSSATSLNPTRTSGKVQWVKMASDHRSSSNLITAIWADENSDLSAMVWSGTAWTNEPSSALETALGYSVAAQDSESFDVAYESLSGNVMVAWSDNTYPRYAICSGGTSSCTWGAPTQIPQVPDNALNISLAANPLNNEIVFAGVSGSSDLEAGTWTGNNWIASANAIDASAATPTAGDHSVSAGWLVNGGLSRAIITYNHGSGTGVGWAVGDGSTFTKQTVFASTPSFNVTQPIYDLQVDPMNTSQAMVLVTDQNSDLFAERLVMASNGTFTWTDADGGTALEVNVSQIAPASSSFAYWRNQPNYTQSDYRWYANANSVQPGSAVAGENTPYTTADTTSQLRLRTQLGVTSNGLSAGNQAYTLQYGTSTSGPWNTVGEQWWNSSWGYRRSITFDNSLSNANLTNFTVLVSLTSSNINYANTKAGGADLRFVGADGTALSYEIEKWNSSGTSTVWVKVPQITGGSRTDHIWMYYGNGSATDAQTPSSTFDSDTSMVQHFEETAACATTFTDSTGNGNNGSCSGTPTYTTGEIGDGRSLSSASSQYITVPDSPSLSPTSQITISQWVNETSLATDQTLISKFVCCGSSNGPWAIQTSSSDSSALRIFVAANTSDAGNHYADTNTGVWTTGWHLVTFTFDGSGATDPDRQKLWIDGVREKLNFGGGTGATALVSDSNPVNIGYFGGLGRYWDGSVDQVEIDDVARSQDWVTAQYKSENLTFNTYGSEQSYSAGGLRFHDNASPAQGATISSTLLTGSNAVESYQEQNPSAVNPTAITNGQSGEWDFALDPTAVTMGTTYYLRMVKPDGTALDTYSSYPEINFGPTLGLGAYRFFANANSTNVGSALAAQDTAATTPAQGTPFRLRTLIHVTNHQYDIGAPSMKLQYAAQSGTCDTSFTGETYTDVSPSSGAIRYYDNTTPADGALIVSNGNDPTSGNTKIPETYEEANNVTTASTIPVTQDGEWDFSLVDFSAPQNTTYCFRIVRSDGTSLESYTVIPQITTNLVDLAPNAPTALTQANSSNTTVSTGGWSNDTTMHFSATATDPDTSDTLSLCVERQPINTAFTGTATACGTGVAYSGTGVSVLVSIGSNVDGTQYHWQAWLKDAAAQVSSVVSYGGNSDGSPPGTPAARDYGTDATAPSTGTVYDGSSAGVESSLNTGSLTTLSGNWSGYTDGSSGIASYDYSIGTSAGATDILTWTNTASTSFTATTLTIHTSQLYYINIRAKDNAGNVSSVISSSGQSVSPTLTLSVSSGTLTFPHLDSSNSYTATQSLNISITTNANFGYSVTQFASQPLTANAHVLPMYSGTWTSPTSWSGSGFGYTSSDTSVSGSNRFANGSNYAGINTSVPGDIIADSSTSAPATDSYTIGYKISTSLAQPSGAYQTSLTYSCTANF